LGDTVGTLPNTAALTAKIHIWSASMAFPPLEPNPSVPPPFRPVPDPNTNEPEPNDLPFPDPDTPQEDPDLDPDLPPDDPGDRPDDLPMPPV
jgi:hypothetical protein